MSEAGEVKANVAIVGGGVAGLEAALGLRALCRRRVGIEILAAKKNFTYRPLAVAQPFGLSAGLEIDLADFGSDNDVAIQIGAVERIDVGERQVFFSGEELSPYDYLIVATGATPGEPLPGALSFIDREGPERFRELLDRIEDGGADRVVFCAGEGPGWILPLYELALMTAAFARARDLSVDLVVVAQEESPLSVFGGGVRSDISRLLAENEVELKTGLKPLRFDDGRLLIADADALDADEVVTLPGLGGPAIRGLPADEGGFIPTDDRGRIAGLDREFAAGDATSFPVKHGGIAAQQADVIAGSIAQAIGEPSDGRPFRPSLEGTLLTGEGVHRLQSSLAPGRAQSSRHQVRESWDPLKKVSARYLGPYLANRSSPG